MKLLKNLLGLTCLKFYFPPRIGGVMGGMGEGETGRGLLYNICSIPPNLPYARGGIRGIKYINFIFCFLLLAMLFVSHSVWAAELSLRSLTAEKLNFGVGQQFLVGLYLNTENEENINAMEGTIYYPRELLELKEIRDGNSIINFWIERPNGNHVGQIHFSGITPGGYKGQKGFIFEVIFEVTTVGSGTIEIREPSVLQNDGKGTSVNVKISNFQFSISQQITNQKLQVPTPIIDMEPPEIFKPEIARDPNLFEGKWFVVFATQDKGSGIDHYEIQERMLNISLIQREETFQSEKWIRVESPYVLQDQGLKSFVYLRAVDKAKNERIAVLDPKVYPQYARYFLWGIVVILIIGYLFVKTLWRKRRKK